jgi:hypothetical protein
LAARDEPAEVQFPKAKLTVRRSLEPKPELLANLDLVGKQKAALSLGITTRTIDRWIKDGKLNPIGVGSRKKFRTKDLLKLLNQNNRGQLRQN